MTTPTNRDPETRLRAAFAKRSSERYQQIRDAYYKMADGIQALTHELECAAGDAADDPLRAEHLVYCEVLNTLQPSLGGHVL